MVFTNINLKSVLYSADLWRKIVVVPFQMEKYETAGIFLCMYVTSGGGGAGTKAPSNVKVTQIYEKSSKFSSRTKYLFSV
jgi:hypothetical protein